MNFRPFYPSLASCSAGACLDKNPQKCQISFIIYAFRNSIVIITDMNKLIKDVIFKLVLWINFHIAPVLRRLFR